MAPCFRWTPKRTGESIRHVPPPRTALRLIAFPPQSERLANIHSEAPENLNFSAFPSLLLLIFSTAILHDSRPPLEPKPYSCKDNDNIEHNSTKMVNHSNIRTNSAATPPTTTSAAPKTTEKYERFLRAYPKLKVTPMPIDELRWQLKHVITTTEPPEPIFVDRSEPLIRVRAGADVLLRCATKRLLSQVWLKDQIPMFMFNMTREIGVTDRYVFVGDLNRANYNLELRNVQVSDSGVWECQVSPRYDQAFRPIDYKVETQLIVDPVPPIELQPSSEFKSNKDMDEIISIDPSDSPPTPSNPSKKINELTVRNAQSQLQPRDISANWTKLTLAQHNLNNPSSGYISPALRPSAFNSYPANIQASSVGRAGGHYPAATILLTWPYLLLALAGLLMVANIYLIYSLVKRHTSRRSSSTASSASLE